MNIVDKSDGTRSLYSNKEYNINEKIHLLTGTVYDKPSRTTIEIGINTHIDDEYGIFMNHSFSPSCKIQDGYIIALRNINSNDELTFNYNDSETSMACPFVDNETKQNVSGKE